MSLPAEAGPVLLAQEKTKSLQIRVQFAPGKRLWAAELARVALPRRTAPGGSQEHLPHPARETTSPGTVGAIPQLTHGCPTALLGCRGTGWSSRQERGTRAAALPLVLGALQEVIFDVAHAVHLVTWGHPPVEAVPAEVVLVWGKEAER